MLDYWIGIISYLIHFTVSLMTATLAKIVDKEAVSSMSYFGEFRRMFVYFHFYITHEAACESLHGLDFCSQYLTTCCNVWTLYTTIFFQYIEIYLLL